MKRVATYPIDQLFLDRWSPRALSGAAIAKEELFALFEAARWAPSSYNNQPWRFVYAMKESSAWQAMFELLVPFNQSWAQHAAALVTIISATHFEKTGKPSRTHSFDTGAAWMNFALQATVQGLIAHAMEGFDYDRAREVLSVPDGYVVEAMVAIGRPGNKADLPPEVQEREQPTDRKPLEQLLFEDRFGNPMRKT